MIVIIAAFVCEASGFVLAHTIRGRFLTGPNGLHFLEVSISRGMVFVFRYDRQLCMFFLRGLDALDAQAWW